MFSQMVYNNLLPSLLPSLFGLIQTSVSSRLSQTYENSNELSRMQLPRVLKWMEMFFTEPHEEESECKAAYRSELYSIYKSIDSDYRQYEKWRSYNKSLWVLRRYRDYPTEELAKKIVSDIVLFHEGMSMFSRS
jgi:hypothetical protein